MAAPLYAGLMSGTSLDGIDGVLVDLEGPSPVRVVAHAWRPYDDSLAGVLHALNRSGEDELHRAALAANALARLSAEVIGALLAQAGAVPGEVRAIGSHGQTVRHRPGDDDGTGYTLQIGQPALLAELSGIDVVADFRARDVAAGGQGAPLVPAFHRAAFAAAGEDLAVLNLGGIANVTLLAANGHTAGWDCGPANVLLDLWCRRKRGLPYDADGAWARSGRCDDALLARLLDEPYFGLPPPKSTGRDRFHAQWLDEKLAGHGSLAPADVQATLVELTAVTCAAALAAQHGGRVLVCGGGALNERLLERLSARLPGLRIVTTGEAGLPPQQVEAAAFAWLARAHLRREPGNLPGVTGARGPRVLGALYPA